MKVHNDLKELLKSYHNYLNRLDNFGNDNPELTAKIFLDFNSLALGKPEQWMPISGFEDYTEPLAKNKDSENICEKCNIPYKYDWRLDYNTCPKCGNDKAFT